ncbi:MAG: hypothetical protein PVJ37_04690 [Desulfobacterales bacterium]
MNRSISVNPQANTLPLHVGLVITEHPCARGAPQAPTPSHAWHVRIFAWCGNRVLNRYANDFFNIK